MVNFLLKGNILEKKAQGTAMIMQEAFEEVIFFDETTIEEENYFLL